MASVLTVNSKQVNLTNLTKPIWPDPLYTKRDLIRYYIQVSPFILPHLRDRPLVVQRFPHGIDGESFYQKNIPEGSPEWIETCPVAHGEDKITLYVLANNVETLVWLGNQLCLELHPWFSGISALDRPDFAVFDLDPMEKSTFEQVCRVALLIRDLLAELNLRCYPKTSGATGLQLYLPLAPDYTYPDTRRFVEEICRQVRERLPDITTMERTIHKRQGKIYLDYLQNGRGKTLAAPYSPRPLPGAPVSMPLSWAEVAGGNIRPDQFTIQSAIGRLEAVGDQFQEVLAARQKLPGIAAAGTAEA